MFVTRPDSAATNILPGEVRVFLEALARSRCPLPLRGRVRVPLSKKRSCV